MTRIEFYDGQLSFNPSTDLSKMLITSCPEGQKATTYGLRWLEVKKLVEALQVMEEEMRPRMEAMQNAVEMAQDLHRGGWTSKRFSDAMHPMGRVTTDMVVADVADALSKLDKEGGQ